MNVWDHGRIVPIEAVRVSPLDEAVLFGFGLFETLRVLEGRPLFARRHAERHLSACQTFGIKQTFDVLSVMDACRSVIDANQFCDGSLRIQTFIQAGVPRVVVSPRDLEAIAFNAARPVSICTEVEERRSRYLGGTKCSNYLPNLLALRRAREAGFDETIFVSPEDVILEGATTNVFWVSEGRVQTPSLDSGILPGIMRGLVVETVRDRCIEGRYAASQLVEADEVFLTNSVRGIIPVCAIDGNELPRELAPGSITRRIMAAIDQLVLSENADIE